jgi:transposase
LYLVAPDLAKAGTHLVSLDEMTGIQALERIAPTKPVQVDQPARREFEYARHGTVSLIANLEVATGQIICPSILPTRTEADLVAHIERTVATDPQAQWIFIADQLNTHQSAGLVELVNRLCRLNEPDLGEKGKSGVLANMASRREFLERVSHRIRFVYTPKHSSWLNQIEIWFSILMRRLLKRGSFSSVEELSQRIKEFIEHFNKVLAKPFKWTYTGRPLQA